MVEKRVNKFGQDPPPPFRAMPERNRFFMGGVPLYPQGVLRVPVGVNNLLAPVMPHLTPPPPGGKIIHPKRPAMA